MYIRVIVLFRTVCLELPNCFVNVSSPFYIDTIFPLYHCITFATGRLQLDNIVIIGA